MWTPCRTPSTVSPRICAGSGRLGASITPPPWNFGLRSIRLRPIVCPTCDANKDRVLECPACDPKGIILVEGNDPWERYRAHFGIAVTPQRLAFEESLSDCFD